MCDTTKLKPFDLERALAGDVIVSKYGRKCKVMLVEGASSTHRFVVIPFGERSAVPFFTTESFFYDFFMAPKKKTVYVNLYKYNLVNDSLHKHAYYYDSATQAEQYAKEFGELSYIAIAVPVEIEV